ncbi:matrix protein [Drosophila immigrans sigmavirus]|uniref:Matrix protein n=1 Tax=Drosophila immigrans sigmavirus TaxID=1002360 RepID=A0A1L3KMY0_9RHAB|nr:matrix protein [Drosophila immigrans sigmavirus]APG78760.1 matrix protein [Drosophila immigrans sigmavirus]
MSQLPKGSLHKNKIQSGSSSMIVRRENDCDLPGGSSDRWQNSFIQPAPSAPPVSSDYVLNSQIKAHLEVVSNIEINTWEHTREIATSILDYYSGPINGKSYIKILFALMAFRLGKQSSGTNYHKYSISFNDRVSFILSFPPEELPSMPIKFGYSSGRGSFLYNVDFKIHLTPSNRIGSRLHRLYDSNAIDSQASKCPTIQNILEVLGILFVLEDSQIKLLSASS